jgi:hypothetical protein
MRCVYAIVLVPAGVAHAGVDASAQAGAGADTSSSYATASGDVGVELGRLVPVARRPLCADGVGCLWTTADPDARDAFRADASGTLEARDDGTRTGYGDVGVTARAFGWKLGVDLALQPLGDLRDGYWQSGRGVVQTRVVAGMAPFITAMHGHGRLELIATDLAVAVRSSALATETDFEFNAAAGSYVGPRSRVDVATLHSIAHDRNDGSGNVVAADTAIDLVGIAGKLSGDLTARAWGGFEALQPLAAYGGATPVGVVVTPRYGAALELRDGDTTGTLGVASWARVDPTGFAADTGQLVTASARWRRARFYAQTTLEGGRLVRRLVADGAPAELAPRGTAMWMGRGELEAGVDLPHALSMIGTAWLEHSDRDDPRWATPTPTGEIENHAGVGIAARWKLANWPAPKT